MSPLQSVAWDLHFALREGEGGLSSCIDCCLILRLRRERRWRPIRGEEEDCPKEGGGGMPRKVNQNEGKGGTDLKKENANRR
jgi:hypothetical protein